MSRFDIARNTNIVQVAEALGLHLNQSGKYLVGACPYPGCATTDGFVVMPDKNRYWCRRSFGAHAHSAGTTIDLVCLARNCKAVDAVNWLLDPFRPQPEVKERPTKSQTDKSAALSHMTDKLSKRTGALLAGSYGQPARDYLARRGLNDNIWKRFGLGSTPYSVVIPWFDKSGNLTAVNHRRIAGDGCKYWFESGVYPEGLFGWHTHQDHRCITLVEGELNAISVHQLLHDTFDVLSTGSTTRKLATEDAAFIAGHDNILLWADEQATVDRWLEAIAGHTVSSKLLTAIVSPVNSTGIKFDASEYQRRGLLGQFLDKRMVQSGVYSYSQESWREIPGYLGYEASTQGHIRNKHSGRVLSASPNNKGYLLTTLSLNHTAHRALVHRLVMLAFVGVSDLQVNHKDGDKTNNHLNNLEYTTCKQNIEHAMTQLGVRYGGDRRQIPRHNGD